MKTAASAIRELAREVLAQEGGSTGEPTSQTAAALKVFERLRLHLTPFVGQAGYQAILSRSLAQARAEDVWLRGSALLPDGTLDFGTNQDAEETKAGMIVLLVQLLGLLDGLVGAALMLRLVQGIWPTVTLQLSLNTHELTTEVIP